MPRPLFLGNQYQPLSIEHVEELLSFVIYLQVTLMWPGHQAFFFLFFFIWKQSGKRMVYKQQEASQRVRSGQKTTKCKSKVLKYRSLDGEGVSWWFDKWPWLHYIEDSDSVLCFTCMKANAEIKHQWLLNAESVFITVGFTKWKKASIITKHQCVTRKLFYAR